MHIPLVPSFWIMIVVLAVVLRHRRRMEAMRLGLSDRWSERRLERRMRRHARYDDEPLAGPGERRELADLRERVKVLERIATDGRSSQDLADEIEALRDRPAAKREQEMEP